MQTGYDIRLGYAASITFNWGQWKNKDKNTQSALKCCFTDSYLDFKQDNALFNVYTVLGFDF